MKKVLGLSVLLVFVLLTAKGAFAYSVTLQNGLNGYTGVQDTYINSTTANTNYGTNTNLSIINSGGNALISFSLTPLTSGATITSALLYLDKYGGPSSSLNLSTYRMTTAWTATGATWNKSDGSNSWGAGTSFSSSNYDSNGVAANVTQDGWNQWDVTSIVNSWWTDTTKPNYGFSLIATSGNSPTRNFYSSEWSVKTLSPKLVIEYSTVSAGSGGTGATPEPASILLLGLGLAGIAGRKLRRKA